MSYYKDVREYLNALEAAGKLVRIKQPINKDTELHPLVRLQYRGLPEEQRRAFFFEKVMDVRGRSFDIPVAVGCYAGNLDIYGNPMVMATTMAVEEINASGGIKGIGKLFRDRYKLQRFGRGGFVEIAMRAGGGAIASGGHAPSLPRSF